MKMKTIAASMALALTSPVFASNMINTGGFDVTKYCLEDGSPRQTYLVIDSSVIAKQDRNWANDILQTLPPSYLPSEEVGVYYISERGNVSHVFTSCYPNEDALPEGGLLTARPDRVVRDDLPRFTRLVQTGLAEAMKASTHDVPPTFADNVPNKDLARSLFQVSNDIRLNGTPIRLVVYSDGVQNSTDTPLSSLTDTDSAQKAAVELARKHHANFNNATVYFHGINSTGVSNAHMEDFWESYLQASAGHLKSYAAGLPGMNRPEYNMPSISESFSGTLTSQGIETLFSLRVERPKGQSRGEINQAFASLNGHGMLLKGTFDSNGKDIEYKLEIVQHHPDIHFEAGDSLVIKDNGKVASGFIGDLNPSTMLDETNSRFQFDVELTKDSFIRF
ncbi:hypothetical protein ACQKPX_16320 [Photobacterium sp. DNB23_23_1]|uniref:VWA domain-containing protein n=1 Tax=Photobacterium pectinilyticum TaxID=2906793 RepID=A0ABT1N3X7_9GAMM|nr:hypothetical protein [Photobacterium sp. ZSDE20]MCQ1057954.1 hypothetical protein [Photobacterium sp. ZSDE20]MDD1822486.1 hypothetical protein [Photobacterium sp. ZSDE20]